jgi:hypothetical protein
LGDPALRGQLLRDAADGVVTIWRGAAARYHIAGAGSAEAPPAFRGEIEGEAPVTTIVAVLDTLADLVEAG